MPIASSPIETWMLLSIRYAETEASWPEFHACFSVSALWTCFAGLPSSGENWSGMIAGFASGSK